MCEIRHFHETLRINTSLMIVNKTIDLDMHRKIKRQDTTSFFYQIFRYSCILGFWHPNCNDNFWHLE